MAAVFAFLISPLGRWLVIAAVAVSVVGYAYFEGRSVGYASAMARVEAQQKKAIALANKAREQLFKACQRDSAACIPEEWFRDED